MTVGSPSSPSSPAARKRHKAHISSSMVLLLIFTNGVSFLGGMTIASNMWSTTLPKHRQLPNQVDAPSCPPPVVCPKVQGCPVCPEEKECPEEEAKKCECEEVICPKVEQKDCPEAEQQECEECEECPESPKVGTPASNNKSPAVAGKSSSNLFPELEQAISIPNPNKKREGKVEKDDMIPSTYRTELGQHGFDPLSPHEAVITWLDAMGLDDDPAAANTTNTGCYLSAGNWTLLSHGAKHWTLTTLMACRNDKTLLFSKPRKVVVRLETRGDKVTKAKSLISKEDPEKLQEQQVFFRQLQGNWTKSQIQAHWCAPLGVVDFAVDYLRDTNRITPLKALGFTTVRTSHSKKHPDWIRAELYEFLPGRHVESRVKSQYFNRKKRGIFQALQDAVRITRHMYHQKTMHCDMHLGHFQAVDDDQDDETSDYSLKMIDFERISTKPSRHKQKLQLWQLWGMLSTTCGWPLGQKGRPDNETYGVSSAICTQRKQWVQEDVYEAQIVPDLLKCPFLEPLNWTRSMLTDVDYGYERLASLVGIQGEIV